MTKPENARCDSCGESAVCVSFIKTIEDTDFFVRICQSCAFEAANTIDDYRVKKIEEFMREYHRRKLETK